MKIESKVRRKGGTIVQRPRADGGENVYQFVPAHALQDHRTVPHYCEVEDPDDIAWFTSAVVPDFVAVPDPEARTDGLTVVPATAPDSGSANPAGIVAAADMTDETYMIAAAALPGLENPNDPNILALYLHNHYGVVSDPSVGALALVKQIVNLQREHDAQNTAAAAAAAAQTQTV